MTFKCSCLKMIINIAILHWMLREYISKMLILINIYNALFKRIYSVDCVLKEMLAFLTDIESVLAGLDLFSLIFARASPCRNLCGDSYIEFFRAKKWNFVRISISRYNWSILRNFLISSSAKEREKQYNQ